MKIKSGMKKRKYKKGPKITPTALRSLVVSASNKGALASVLKEELNLPSGQRQ